MALKLIIAVSKKIPGPQEFSSVQASCTIEGEIAAGQHPAEEAAKLYAQSEAAVDRQLGLAGAVPAPPPASPGATPAAAPAPIPSSPSRPYRRTAPAPITASQLRFLQRLIDQTRTPVAAILARFQVGGLEHLSCKDAAHLIDEIKAGAAS